MSRLRHLALIALIAAPVLALAQTAAERREALSRMIPQHPEFLGALAGE